MDVTDDCDPSSLPLHAWEGGKAKGDLNHWSPKMNYARSVGVAFGHSSCESVWAFRLGRLFSDTLADVQANYACQRTDIAFLESTVM